jgi:hypothetical protein
MNTLRLPGAGLRDAGFMVLIPGQTVIVHAIEHELLVGE